MAEPALARDRGGVADDTFARTDAARLTSADGAAFAAFALRTRSLGAREVLARAATRGALDRASYLSGRPDSRSVDVDPEWAAWFAYVEALSPGTDPETALLMLDVAAAACRDTGLPTKVADVRVQSLLRAGARTRTTEALAGTPVSDATRWEVECDLANPYLWPDENLDEHLDEQGWLDLLSRPFVAGGVEPVTVGADGDTPFARLRANATPVDSAAGLVSVVMSAYQPDRDIIAAARSILDQTWQDLELLVVDDASPPGSEAIFSEVAALDPRVRVLRAPTNGGTYQVRNLALQEARGEFMTFQDSDDWSHPRRLEVQVRPLLDDPAVLATRTPAVRAYPDLSLTWPGYPAERPNASSLLFRRKEVHDLIGDFDPVRKSADMEYPRRLQALRRGSVLDVTDHGPMAITELRHGSLSRADAVPGWIRWTRLSYHDAYVEWHERIRNGSASPRLTSGAPRPFPMPDPTWSPWRTSTEIPREHFDVVFLGDWRSGQNPHRHLLDEMRLLASSGLRVGLAHVETPFPLPPKRQPRARQVQRLVNAGVVELTHLDRAADVDLLLVTAPASLTYLPSVDLLLEPRSIAVLHDGPRTTTSSVQEADAAARTAFHVAPVWVARHEAALEDLHAAAPGIVDDEVLPYAADPATLGVTERRLLGPEPVLGHHLPDEASRWPTSPGALLAAYPAEGADVRLLNGTTAAARLVGASTHPVGWLSFDGVDLPTRTFLSRLDFFVYLGVRDPVADHALLEAMLAGCVPVVNEEFRPVAGPGACYVADAAEVPRVVAQLAADTAAFRAVQERARGAGTGMASFRDHIQRLRTVPPTTDTDKGNYR